MLQDERSEVASTVRTYSVDIVTLKRTKTCWIAIAMIIPCSQHDDGAQKSHHVTEFVWSA